MAANRTLPRRSHCVFLQMAYILAVYPAGLAPRAYARLVVDQSLLCLLL